MSYTLGILVGVCGMAALSTVYDESLVVPLWIMRFTMIWMTGMVLLLLLGN